MDIKQAVKNIGFIGAHMDDIELGCGGTIQVLKKKRV
jgi:LmbE family N-acetylglucosaminyl deacetylase